MKKRADKKRLLGIVAALSLLSICLPCSLQCRNRQFHFEQITQKEGLSHSNVNCIIQDKRGFLWFGTEDGLDRYDGYTFCSYRHDPEDPNSLSDNYVIALLEDHFGNLWIGTIGGGLNRFDPVKEIFFRYKSDSKNPNSLSHNSIFALAEGKDGHIWIGTLGGGLNRFDSRSDVFVRYQADSSKTNTLTNNQIWSLYVECNGTLWIGTNGGGLNRFDPHSQIFTPFVHRSGDANSLANNRVFAINADDEGQLLIGTYSGLDRFDTQNEVFHHIDANHGLTGKLSNPIITSVYEDHKGLLWIGTFKGLNILDRQTGSITKFLANPTHEGTISDDTIRTIFEDRFGQLWIGTMQGGLNKINREKMRFNRYEYSSDGSIGLCSHNVTSIYQNHANEIWIGTAEGLCKLDLMNRRFLHFKDKYSNKVKHSDRHIMAILIDSRGTNWVGTLNGLYQLDHITSTLRRYHPKPGLPSLLSNIPIMRLVEDSEGELWVGTTLGLYRLDSRRSQMKSYKADFEGRLSNNIVLSIFEDSRGLLWVGTTEGLNRYSKETDNFHHYLYNSNHSGCISNNKITTIFEDHAGMLWVGTYNGLNRYNRDVDTFTRYTTKDGLASDVISGIVEDNDQNLWISTTKGLSKFNPRLGFFKNYESMNGYASNQFNPGACLKTHGGEVFFGGVEGLVSFFPEQLKDNQIKPIITITNLKIFNTPIRVGEKINGRIILKKSITQTKAIRLTHRDSLISLEFAALHYAAPRRNQYAFKMEGLEKDWNYVGNQRFATYAHLSPGEYCFRVKGSNNDGIWNEDGTALFITIFPPWWQTWWAYTLFGFLIVSLFISSHKIRVRHLSRRKEELANQVKVRTEELATVNQSLREANTEINTINENLRQSMLELSASNEELRKANELKSEFLGIAAHDLRNPLQIILGFTELIDIKLRQKNIAFKELKLINRSVEKMLGLITELLDAAHLDKGLLQLNTSRVNITEMTRMIVKNHQSIARKKNQTVLFPTTEECYAECDKLLIWQVIENLISNAIKYSPLGKRILINVISKAGNIRVSVRDEGPGLTKNDKKLLFRRFQRLSAKPTAGESSTGLGLSICKDFIELHDGRIYAEGEQGKGTTFYIEFPQNIEEKD